MKQILNKINLCRIIKSLGGRGAFNWLSDEKYLKMLWRLKFHNKLDLKNPKTFNEKLQWLKIYDRNPMYTTMVDKYAAKKYVAEQIGEEYIIPTLGVWNHFDDIEFDKLPNQFVLKCTHDSGGLFVVRDKSEFDKDAARKLLERNLKRNFYYGGREWPYKNVPPRIIAEQYMEDYGITYTDKSFKKDDDLKDYKLMCFNGEVKCSFVCSDRFSDKGLHVTFFDRNWNVMPFNRHYPRIDEGLPKPKHYEEMIQLAEKLSKNIPFVRVDFYEINNQVYFGELTFYPGSGFEEFEPPKYDEILGKMIALEKSGGVKHKCFTVNFCENQQDLRDYKFFCFNGEPIYCQVISDRSTNETIDFFDMEWNHQDFTGLALPKKPFSNSSIPIPVQFDEMKKIAKILAKESHFLRVDFYETIGQLYFGELTFYPASGFGVFTPDRYNLLIGEFLKLPQKSDKKFVYNAQTGGRVTLVDISADFPVYNVSQEIKDYKFFCFNGKPKFLYLSQGLENHATARISYVTLDWQQAPFYREDYKPFKQLPPKPINFEKMIMLAEKLSHDMPFLRVDFYEINGQIYFGELTFHTGSGFTKFVPDEYDEKIGNLIKLPKK